MREILAETEAWRRSGIPFALATVVEVWGSAPRRPGSKMAVSADGGVAGSVSGGCVEGAVVEAASSVLETGLPRLLGYGVSDETAWSVGLTCGGRIGIFLEPWRGELLESVAECVARDELVARAVVLGGPELGKSMLIWPGGQVLGDLGGPRLNQRAALFAEKLLPGLTSARKSFGRGEAAVDVFCDVHPPRPRLVVVGAVHVAVPLGEMARNLGFRTVVVDPRGAFATRERFPAADELLVEWPGEALDRLALDENTHVAVLAHDLKIDGPALAAALRSRAGYIGALGSRKTHARRVEALLEAGFAEAGIGRIHSPIGLDLGGRRPEEIALSILAQIVAVAHGRAG